MSEQSISKSEAIQLLNEAKAITGVITMPRCTPDQQGRLTRFFALCDAVLNPPPVTKPVPDGTLKRSLEADHE